MKKHEIKLKLYFENKNKNQMFLRRFSIKIDIKNNHV